MLKRAIRGAALASPESAAETGFRDPRPLIVSILVALGAVFLGMAWSFSLPFSGVADERAHLIKALGVASGDLAGKPDTSAPPPGQLPFITANYRVVRVPAHLNPDEDANCFILKPNVSASCLRPVRSTGQAVARTYVGPYPPVPYVLPGIIARFTSTPSEALLAARLANGFTCALLWLAAGIGYLAGRSRGNFSGVVLCLAITPAALCLAWSLNPNGVEAAAGVAFVSLSLAATRADAPRRVWWLLGPVGFVLGTSRPLAFLWVGFGLLVPLLLRPRAEVVAAVRRGGRAAIAGISVSVIGALTTVVWNLALKTRAPTGEREWSEVVRSAVDRFRSLQSAAISQVDWGETGLRGHPSLAWELLLVGLLIFALVLGSWRQRAGLVALIACYLVVNVALIAFSWGSGFPTGGRYFLAAAVALPLASGEVWRDRDRDRGRLIGAGLLVAVVAALIVAATHLAILFASGRRYAVGARASGYDFLFTDASWHGYASWPVVLVLALIGAALLVAVPVVQRGRAPAA